MEKQAFITPPYVVNRRDSWCNFPRVMERMTRIAGRLPRIIETASKHQHHNSSRTISSAPETNVATAALNPRWLSDLKGRVGRCILFGLQPPQIVEASSILRSIARDWRELVAGSEGYLTTWDRRGLFRQAVVWGEMDVMGHVNNVTYVRYAESARIIWAQNFAKYIDPMNGKRWVELWSPRGDGLILRSIKVDFKFPIVFPDRISVYHKLRSLPSKSTEAFELDVLVLSERHQRAAARCVEDIVIYDYQQGRKTAIRPFMFEAFRKTFELQEIAKERNNQHVRALLNGVERLEEATWNRSDAQEDLGGP